MLIININININYVRYYRYGSCLCSVTERVIRRVKKEENNRDGDHIQ